MKEHRPESEKDNFRPLYVFVCIVVILWLLTMVLSWKGLHERKPDDLFGATEALFSGLAMAGVIFTILLQRNELSLQRNELRETRQEFEIQNETLKIQSFENTFFQLVSLHHEIVNSLEYKLDYDHYLTKREVFSHALSQLNQKIHADYFEVKQVVDGYGGYTYKEFATQHPLHYFESRLVNAYKDVFATYSHVLAHYFRNLYHIFKYVYTTDLIKETDKPFYASIVRAQLTSKELALLVYNAMVAGLGNPNFLFLIKEFDIVQNLNLKKELLFEQHAAIFQLYTDSVINPFPTKRSQKN